MKIAILGHGVVGSGVVEVLTTNRSGIEKKAGCPVEIKYILDRKDFPDLPYSHLFVKDFEVIAADPEVDVVVEVMGGVEPAFTFVSRSLSAGKNVVTSNKELVAAKGAELLALAARHNVNFLFEASVGGGIPIIKPLHLCLGANEITAIAGILNGTTNFILTKMIREKMAFEEALALAQQLGYAERDPSADVEGHDACRKICILASLAFGRHIYPQWVHTEGITAITPDDVACAAAWGGAIKLIGQARLLEDDKLAILVSPALVSRDSQLSTVDDVYNGILVRGNASGDVMFYGKGAGKLPTASAVVSDIIDAIRAEGTIHTLQWKDGDGSRLEPFEECPVSALVRLESSNQATAKFHVLFGEAVSVTAPKGQVAFVTPRTTEGELARKLDALRENDVKVLGMVRVLEE